MKKKYWTKLISWTIIGLILVFLFKVLLANWQKVKEYHFEINPYYLILSFLLFWLGSFIASQVWRFILLKSGLKSSIWKTFRIHFLSRFGVYIPGKVWFLLIRSRLSRKDNLSQKTIVTSSILELGIDLIAPLIISLIFMGGYFLNKPFFMIAIIILILGGALILRPKLFYSILNFGLKKIKKEPVPKNAQLTSTNLLLVLILSFVFWLIWGIGFYFFIISITPMPFDKIWDVASIYIVSATAGTLALFAPYGIGVREGIQAYLLSHLLPLEIAILISLLARIWVIANDVIWGLVIQAISSLSCIFSNKKPRKKALAE